MKYAADSRTWLQWADHTYRGAQALWSRDDMLLWFPAAILGHQALEMYLKAALINHGHRVEQGDVWGHDLTMLYLRLMAHVPSLPDSLKSDLAVFDAYFNELRYPSDLKDVEGLGSEEGALLDGLVRAVRPCAVADNARS